MDLSPVGRSPNAATKKRKVDESKLTPVQQNASDGSVSGMRKQKSAHRSGTTTLSDFEKLMVTRRSREIETLNKDFQTFLGSIHLPSDANSASGGPDHADYSQIEMAIGQYQMLVNEITRRYGGETVGNVVTFGLNDMDQLGFPNQGRDTFPPRIVSTLLAKKTRQVEAGGMHSIALQTNGVPWSWGVNDDGPLGRTTPSESAGTLGGEVTGFVTKSGIKEDGQITQVSAGASHSLFLSFEGNVYSAGMFKEEGGAMLKIPTNDKESVLGVNKAPQHIWQMPQKAILIDSGGDFAAAILEDRTMVTWGFGHSGELGRSADMATPNRNGEYDLMPAAMGYNKVDQDDNKFIDQNILKQKFMTPKPPRFNWGSPKKAVLTLSCGLYHILVVAREPGASETNVYSAGHNGYGQLGHGDENNRHELTLIKRLEGENIAQVAAGEHFSMALCMVGKRLFTFGRGDKGCLGTGVGDNKSASLVPVVVPFPEDKPVLIAKISAGDRHAFALTPDHELYSWGFEGVTGHKDAAETDTLRPRKLEVSDKKRAKVFDISGGGQHSAAIVMRYGSISGTDGGKDEMAD